jgi:glycosyltransferase involved in cell wall biosynthesis
MEAMACGLPVIVANNTGMKDLVTEHNCVALQDQKPVDAIVNTGTSGWGESNVDEIVNALDMLYEDSEQRRKIGESAYRWISSERTWRTYAAKLKALALSAD